jgi:hypothetical protein
LLVSVAPLQAVELVNGNFSAGLAGWTTADTDASLVEGSPSASVAAVGGVAELDTQGFDSGIIRVSVNQPVLFDPTAVMLSFDLGFRQGLADSGTGNGFPDYLEAQYLDASDPAYDRRFIAVDVNGFYDPDTLLDQSLPDLGNGLFRFAAPIADLAGRSGTLYFDLNEQDDLFHAQGRVDNVSIGLAQVPEPGTWLLMGLGLAAAARPRRPAATPT